VAYAGSYNTGVCRRWSAIEDVLHLIPEHASTAENNNLRNNFINRFNNTRKISMIKTRLISQSAEIPSDDLVRWHASLIRTVHYTISPPSVGDVMKYVGYMPAKSTSMDKTPTSVIKVIKFCPKLFAGLRFCLSAPEFSHLSTKMYQSRACLRR